jgi:3-deoxy-D-manno-octulosonic acid kinase
MSNAARRIATETGVMLADPELLGNEAPQPADCMFDPQYWQVRAQLTAAHGGRGSAWFVGPSGHWVLRHYRRGGWAARISGDRYAWCGENAVRSFAEWRLLETLVSRGLPVPRPVAARYQRSGLLYRCDLITERLANTRSLSEALTADALTTDAPAENVWRRVGAVVAQLHHHGVDHADLNAHNILLGADGAVSVIDFDRGRLRAPGDWRRRNLQRLHRSLLKVSRGLSGEHFSARQWSWLLTAYEAAAHEAATHEAAT